MPAADPTPRSRIVPTLVLVVLAALLVGLAAFGLYARAQGSSEDSGDAATAGEPLTWTGAQGTSLPGVGRVEGLSLPCTAWLLDTGSAAAYAVTTGRCAGITDSSTVLSDTAVDGAKVTFRQFADAPAGSRTEPIAAAIDEVTWASMRGTDLALLRLATPASELSAAGIPAIKVAAPLPDGGELLVAGLPVAGGADGSSLRGTRCQAGATVSVAEGPWLLHDLQASDCAGIVNGSFGSVALDSAGAAVGLVATTTIGSPSGAPCQLRSPCELGSGMVSVHPDTTYLVNVSSLGSCFTRSGFQLGGDCPLESPSGVVAAELSSSRTPAGDPVTVTVQPADETAEPASMQVRTGMLGSTDCWSPTGWSTRPVTDGELTVTAPTEQGLAVVCVGSPAQPTPLMLTVSAGGPTPDQVRVTERTTTGGVTISAVLTPPEVASMSWTIEPGTSASCASAEGYVTAPSTPTFIPAHDLPATVCAIAADAAGNSSQPVAIRVGVS